MHAPGHLFCSGTFAPALAAAAWAGYLVAQGKLGDASEWQERAVKELGRCFVATPSSSGGQLEVRLIGSDFTELAADDLDCLIEILKLTRRGCERRENNRAADAVSKTPPATDPEV
jgi:hypothetical protein